jgi:hypothetical protein
MQAQKQGSALEAPENNFRCAARTRQLSAPNNPEKTMVTTIASSSATASNAQLAPEAAAGGVTIDPAVKDNPPEVLPLALLILQTFQILSSRIGANAAAVSTSLQQKKDAISACLELLQGVNSWNTPPIVPKIPSNPLDPAYQDRVDKTDALYLNGVSISDNDYDAVKYTYGDPPETAYSALPIPQIGEDDLEGGNLVVGQLYSVVFVTSSKTVKEDLVYGGRNNPGIPPGSPLELKTQSGTDFTNVAPGDLVQDTDTGRYYRVANDKSGVEVTGYPLQKYVQSPDVDTLASLRAQINQKITASSDLSKADSLEIQRLQGFLSTVVTMCVDLAATNNSTRNSIINSRI